jgi:hypothetical protein
VRLPRRRRHRPQLDCVELQCGERWFVVPKSLLDLVKLGGKAVVVILVDASYTNEPVDS